MALASQDHHFYLPPLNSKGLVTLPPLSYSSELKLVRFSSPEPSFWWRTWIKHGDSEGPVQQVSVADQIKQDRTCNLSASGFSHSCLPPHPSFPPSIPLYLTMASWEFLSQLSSPSLKLTLSNPHDWHLISSSHQPQGPLKWIGSRLPIKKQEGLYANCN